jgi:hypothetical protein
MCCARSWSICANNSSTNSEKDKHRSLLRELLEAQRNRKSERLSKEQLGLFEALWKASAPEEEEDSEPAAEPEQDEPKERQQTKKSSGRQALSKDLTRERSYTICRKPRSIAAAAGRICGW